MEPLRFETPLTAKHNELLKQEYGQRLSQRIKELRKEKGYTQQQLSEAAGLHLTYLGHLELGKYRPTTFITWKIAKALGVSLSDLADF